MDGRVHMMPAAEFLFGAVDRKRGRIDASYGQQYLVVCQDICIEKVVDDRRKEDE